MKTHSKPPLWAALGAPLVGVPLMVALVAIGAGERTAPAVEPAPVVVAEPLDSHGAEPASTDSAERPER